MAESRPNRTSNNVFVGREMEMAELRAALDDAISGHGRMIMLAGEPGIGKTRNRETLPRTCWREESRS